MRCEAWEPVKPEPEPEKVNQVRMVPYGGHCAMVVVNDTGSFINGGRVAVLTGKGLRREEYLSNAFGFPLDDKGRIKLDE